MKGKLGEKLILARLKNKDKKAFSQAYDLYIDKIYRFIYFKIGDRAEAEDLTSAVFLKTWNHIQQKSITDEKTLPALIYKIARNVVIDHLRSSVRLEESINNPGGEAREIVDEKQDIKRLVEFSSDLMIVQEKLLELKDEHREVIVLRFIDEFSISEIAEILDKSKGNVRIILYRALGALRELIDAANQ